MAAMANHSYLNVWCKDFPEEFILERLGGFLETVPFSATKPGFTYLAIRAVDPSETAVVEQDLRAVPHDAAGIIELVREQLHSDTSYEIGCHWDLALFDAVTGKSKAEPQPVEILCRGEDFDSGFWRESGHFEVNLGFEHFFTGHAGLLGMRPGPKGTRAQPRRGTLSGSDGLARKPGKVSAANTRKHPQAPGLGPQDRERVACREGAAVVGRRGEL